MGLFIQDEKRSDLQQKIAADITERQRARDIENEKARDGVEDSRLVEGTSRVSKFGIALLVLLVAAVIAVVIIVGRH